MSEKTLRQLLEELGVKREEKPSFTSFQEYLNFLHKIVQDERTARTILSTAENYWKNFMNVYEKYGEKMKKRAEEVRKIKEYSIEHLDELIKIACENIEANKGHCYLAKDSQEANKIVAEIVGDAKTIVKAKSITSEELYLREYLEELGKDVYETDLGEFLVQVLGPKPMHFTSPALHLSRERVAEFLEKLTGQKIDFNDIPGMVALVRKFLRQKFIEAEVGISGANVIAADPGQVFIIENESNARLATSLPDKHVVVAGIEKIVPEYMDAVKVVDVIMKYSGYRTVSYVNIVGGPSKTGDIEKKITYGAHGPREFHVVLLDNGRSQAAKDPVFKEALYCLRCGACMYVCPVFRLYSGYWGGDVYMGGIGTIWTAITEGIEKAYPLSFLCLLDNGCKEQCPMKIDQSKILRIIRKKGNMLRKQR